MINRLLGVFGFVLLTVEEVQAMMNVINAVEALRQKSQE